MQEAKIAAYALYLSGVNLPDLVSELNGAGFLRQSICLALPPTHSTAQTLRALKAGTLSPADVCVVEQTLDWVMKFGAVIIPGVGLFVAGREYVGVLFGSRPQKHSCRSVLEALGISPAEARRCETWVEGSGVLAFVSCTDAEAAMRAQEILEEAGAEEVCRLGGSAAEVEITFHNHMQASV